MTNHELRQNADRWIEDLKESGKSENTIKQYQKSLEWFFKYLADNEINEITKGTVNRYKESMIAEIQQNNTNPPTPPKGEKWKTERPLTKYSTANVRLKAVNALFRSLNEEDLIVEKIKESRPSSSSNEILNNVEYLRIMRYLKSDKVKLILETLLFTGMRISELEGLTVDSLNKRFYEFYNKGKAKVVYIPKGLAKKLKAYCKENGIKKGIIFRSRPLTDQDGHLVDLEGNRVKEPVYKLISQSYIRDEMKRAAGQARMKRSKAFPHSLRHLFSKNYSAMPTSDYYILPQLLGHSAPTVTSIYTQLSDKELLKVIDELEVFIKSQLKEAQATLDKNTKIAEAKKRRNRRKKENK